MSTLEHVRDSYDGKGIEVAIIDSGIDATHEDLHGSVTRAVRVVEAETGIAIESASLEENNDDFGHGAAVASVLHSIAPEAKLIDIKVLNEFNACTGDILIKGLKWALEQGYPIINMSLATAKEKFRNDLHALCEQAYLQGTLIVASRRNVGPIGFPAYFSNVISVDREEYRESYSVSATDPASGWNSTRGARMCASPIREGAIRKLPVPASPHPMSAATALFFGRPIRTLSLSKPKLF